MMNTEKQKTVKSRKMRYLVIFLVGLLVGFVLGYLTYSYRQETGIFSANTVRDLQAQGQAAYPWAQPLELAGLPNLHKVSKDLYRGAQPTAEGMKNLEQLGVRTIVSLRSFSSDQDLIQNTDLDYEHITMKAWHPEIKEVLRFLQIVTDKDRTPIFVHCQHGADRTGTMCAVYRILIEGWSKEQALEEMTKGGFGFHKTWTKLTKFIQNLNVEELKQQLNLD